MKTLSFVIEKQQTIKSQYNSKIKNMLLRLLQDNKDASQHINSEQFSKLYNDIKQSIEQSETICRTYDDYLRGAKNEQLAVISFQSDTRIDIVAQLLDKSGYVHISINKAQDTSKVDTIDYTENIISEDPKEYVDIDIYNSNLDFTKYYTFPRDLFKSILKEVNRDYSEKL